MTPMPPKWVIPMGMANMVLATEAASRRGLSHDLRERLSKAAAKRSRPHATAEEPAIDQGTSPP
jgi:hypothetical protein